MSSSKKSIEKKQPKKELFLGVKGMSDILPKDADLWKYVWQVGHTTSEVHDFHYIETPIAESAGLFETTVGVATDIVEKQMYVFTTKGNDRLTLRPEGTAPVMRSYLEHHLGYFASPLKVYYYGPMFRYEKPQAGRERQFHQWGFEIIGDSDPFYDAEIIRTSIDFFRGLKCKSLIVKINSIGCRTCRASYRESLKRFYHSKKDKLCENCVNRYDKNPLRLLDCSEEGCLTLRADAPLILDYLCQTCNTHFKAVLELVEDNGIPYEMDPYLVRGLDYYNRTVFELYSTSLKSAVGGGGRYDYLAEALSGRSVPAVGVALGMERVIHVLRAEEIVPHLKPRPKIFFAAVGDQAKKASMRLMGDIRMSGVVVVEALSKKSLKSQLKAADKARVPLALILGQQEVFEGTILVRDMQSGAQESILSAKLVDEIKKRLRP